jgi:hypothetical protein
MDKPQRMTREQRTALNQARCDAFARQRDELLGKGVVVTVGNITIDSGPDGTAPQSPALKVSWDRYELNIRFTCRGREYKTGLEGIYWKVKRDESARALTITLWIALTASTTARRS